MPQRHDDASDRDEIRDEPSGAFRAGDRAAMEQLLVRHLNTLRAFVRLQVGPELRAYENESDVVQSVCRELLEKRLAQLDYRGESAFRNWLYGAVLLKVRERLKFRRAEKRAPHRLVEDRIDGLSALYSDVFTPSAIAAAREQIERVEAAFERLPENYRRVLVLSRLVGLPHAEIAAELDTSENNVSQLLKRATVRLSRELVALPGGHD